MDGIKPRRSTRLARSGTGRASQTASHVSTPSLSAAAPRPGASRLLELPLELQLAIISRLPPNDIATCLRPTCRAFMELLTGPTHKRVRLSEPVHPQAFRWALHNGFPNSATSKPPPGLDGLTHDEKTQLSSLLAGAGVLANLVALHSFRPRWAEAMRQQQQRDLGSDGRSSGRGAKRQRSGAGVASGAGKRSRGAAATAAAAAVLSDAADEQPGGDEAGAGADGWDADTAYGDADRDAGDGGRDGGGGGRGSGGAAASGGGGSAADGDGCPMNCSTPRSAAAASRLHVLRWLDGVGACMCCVRVQTAVGSAASEEVFRWYASHADAHAPTLFAAVCADDNDTRRAAKMQLLLDRHGREVVTRRALTNAAARGDVSTMALLHTTHGVGLDGAAVTAAAAGDHGAAVDWLLAQPAAPPVGLVALAAAAEAGRVGMLARLSARLGRPLPPLWRGQLLCSAAAKGAAGSVRWLLAAGRQPTHQQGERHPLGMGAPGEDGGGGAGGGSEAAGGHTGTHGIGAEGEEEEEQEVAGWGLPAVPEGSNGDVAGAGPGGGGGGGGWPDVAAELAVAAQEALEEAAVGGHYQVMRLLLQAGLAAPTARVMEYAAEAGSARCMQLLLVAALRREAATAAAATATAATAAAPAAAAGTKSALGAPSAALSAGSTPAAAAAAAADEAEAAAYADGRASFVAAVAASPAARALLQPAAYVAAAQSCSSPDPHDGHGARQTGYSYGSRLSGYAFGGGVVATLIGSSHDSGSSSSREAGGGAAAVANTARSGSRVICWADAEDDVEVSDRSGEGQPGTSQQANGAKAHPTPRRKAARSGVLGSSASRTAPGLAADGAASDAYAAVAMLGSRSHRSLEALQLLAAVGCPRGSEQDQQEATVAAALVGSGARLGWLRRRGWAWGPAAFAAAANSGCVALVEWMAAQGCPLGRRGEAYLAAGANSDFALLTSLRRLGCPWAADTLPRAVHGAWGEPHYHHGGIGGGSGGGAGGGGGGGAHYYSALASVTGGAMAVRCRLEVLQWMVARGCPTPAQALRVARDYSRPDVATWLRRIGVSRG